MAIRRDEVVRIAELAKLVIPEERMERMATDLSAVLEFVTALNRLDLGGVEPTNFTAVTQPLRDDVPNGRRLATEDALAMAPAAEAGFILVPPIVEHLEP
jgi:aspartyl-tRNA(Asn)/glutamyl-tRNA(Gln) amidotransferase subunit C